MTPQPPRTPKKGQPRADELENLFRQFSDQYNLNLVRPERNTSPAKSRQNADLDTNIFWQFQFHWYQRSLSVVFDIFRERAVASFKGWSDKPLGESDTLPSITGLPRAANERERSELKDLLVSVLNERHPRSLEQTQQARVVRDIHGSHSPESPSKEHALESHDFIRTRSRSKRPSGEWPQEHGSPLPKKAKGVISSEITGTNQSDQCAGSHSRASPVTSARAETSRLRLTRSFDGQSNISKETLSSVSGVFSRGTLPSRASHGTQTTVEASSQEQKRLSLFNHPAATQDSYSVTSSAVQALHESFSEIEHNQDLHQNVKNLLGTDLSSSSHHSYSNFSMPKEVFDLEQQRASTSKLPPMLRRFEQRFQDIWPPNPPSMKDAPLPIIWEIQRVLMHCGVDARDFHLPYDPAWKNDQREFWATLQNNPLLKEKTLPERSRGDAWEAAFNNFQSAHQVVVLSATLDFNISNTGPLFLVKLHPLRLDLSHRLSRRFGSDRFLEILFPSLEPSNLPYEVKKLEKGGLDRVQHWLNDGHHFLVGRLWKRFFIRPVRDGASKKEKVVKSDGFEPDPKVEVKDRVFLFAETGNDFSPKSPQSKLPTKGEGVDSHTYLDANGLVDWLLQIPDNQDQPYLKLFSRIALGLSRTYATVVLQRDQIRHKDRDILSATGAVMNDGIGRMSPNLARRVRNALELSDTPAGFQGRIGSAKGFWIVDITENGNDDWIETFPSQRKWRCAFDEEDHRTFEVRSEVRELRPANLNMQFLPILEARAPDKLAMKTYIGGILARTLQADLDEQRSATQDPLQFRAWIHEHGTSSTARRAERLALAEVPFLASLPRSKDDQMAFLLDGGFHPMKQKFLWDLGWDMRTEKCKELKKRMNLRLGQSTFAYMVVDFTQTLKEDEVHLGFSSKFQDTQSDFSATYLHGMDVLVARSPAHFESDIQKVRAVFRPELGCLKDVIVFPSTGNTPLADKLSGGDYDGDMAWVCWDQSIVNNFENALVPPCPNLFEERFLSKKTETYGNLVEKFGEDHANRVFFERSFAFNMQPKLLGRCTNFKERLCYQRHPTDNPMGDDIAVRLSTLLSNLVDQSKQGIVFSPPDWLQFRNALIPGRPDPPQPGYKSDHWQSKGEPSHILDYLKFRVANPLIDRELKTLHDAGNGKDGTGAVYGDEDLTKLADYYNTLAREEKRQKPVWAPLMLKLKQDLDNIHWKWTKMAQSKDTAFEVEVPLILENFRAISPESSTELVSHALYGQGNPDYTTWALLKASVLFKNYYNRGKFVWWVAGRQLQWMKAMARKGEPLALIIPEHYAALRPDVKYIKAAAARAAGNVEPMDGREDEEEIPRDDDV